MLQTEFPFQLPAGFIDERGNLHRQGVMRRASALDEIEPLGHPRVKANEAYLTIVLLSRVIVRLGSLPAVTTDVIERLFSSDFSYLQQLYLQINRADPRQLVETECPNCATRFLIDIGQIDE